jgi:hypothetical protein
MAGFNYPGSTVTILEIGTILGSEVNYGCSFPYDSRTAYVEFSACGEEYLRYRLQTGLGTAIIATREAQGLGIRSRWFRGMLLQKCLYKKGILVELY